MLRDESKTIGQSDGTKPASDGVKEAKASPKPLSKNKQAFMRSFKPETASSPLTVAEMKVLISHLSNKHKIKIIFNGETEIGTKLIGQNIEELQQKIRLLEASAAHYVKEFYLAPDTSPSDSYDPFNIWRFSQVFSEDDYQEISQALSTFIKQGKLKVSPADEEKFAGIVSHFSCLPFINTQTAKYLKKLKDDVKVTYLTQAQAYTEISAIQKTLSPNDAVGYVYCYFNHNELPPHFECIIVTQDKVIKPVNWGASPQTIQSDECFTLPQPDQLRAQSTWEECGTLALLYLKELLKNNQAQLKECLQFSHYDEASDNHKFNIFIPTPQVLRYSQSTKFNKYVRDFISEEKEVTVHIEKRAVKFPSLAQKLVLSMKIAQEKKDNKTYQANKSLLENLPAYRKKWLAEYNQMESMRQQMNDTWQSYNRYLLYRAQKFEKISKEKAKVSSALAVTSAPSKPG